MIDPTDEDLTNKDQASMKLAMEIPWEEEEDEKAYKDERESFRTAIDLYCKGRGEHIETQHFQNHVWSTRRFAIDH